MKRCSPPSAATRSSPGLRCRWKALARRPGTPSERTASEVAHFTVPRVATGKKAGSFSSPCPVMNLAARAEDPASRASITKRPILVLAIELPPTTRPSPPRRQDAKTPRAPRTTRTSGWFALGVYTRDPEEEDPRWLHDMTTLFTPFFMTAALKLSSNPSLPPTTFR